MPHRQVKSAPRARATARFTRRFAVARRPRPPRAPLLPARLGLRRRRPPARRASSGCAMLASSEPPISSGCSGFSTSTGSTKPPCSAPPVPPSSAPALASPAPTAPSSRRRLPGPAKARGAVAGYLQEPSPYTAASRAASRGSRALTRSRLLTPLVTSAHGRTAGRHSRCEGWAARRLRHTACMRRPAVAQHTTRHSGSTRGTHPRGRWHQTRPVCPRPNTRWHWPVAERRWAWELTITSQSLHAASLSGNTRVRLGPGANAGARPQQALTII